MADLTYLKVVYLSILQGITEFLPVSSSGHLKVFEIFFGIKGGTTSFDVMLHLGTLVAVLIFFRSQILNLLNFKNKKFFYIVVASIPTGILGIFLGKWAEKNLYSSFLFLSIFFILNGFIILSTLLVKNKGSGNSVLKSLLIGTAQGFGVMRGISRSGITISAGLHLGLNREEAFNFSFLISIPAILGASLLEIKDGGFSNLEFFKSFLGFVLSFLSGYLALILLKRTVINKKFYYFGIYTIILGLVLIFV